MSSISAEAGSQPLESDSIPQSVINILVPSNHRRNTQSTTEVSLELEGVDAPKPDSTSKENHAETDQKGKQPQGNEPESACTPRRSSKKKSRKSSRSRGRSRSKGHSPTRGSVTKHSSGSKPAARHASPARKRNSSVKPCSNFKRQRFRRSRCKNCGKTFSEHPSDSQASGTAPLKRDESRLENVKNRLFGAMKRSRTVPALKKLDKGSKSKKKNKKSKKKRKSSKSTDKAMISDLNSVLQQRNSVEDRPKENVYEGEAKGEAKVQTVKPQAGPSDEETKGRSSTEDNSHSNTSDAEQQTVAKQNRRVSFHSSEVSAKTKIVISGPLQFRRRMTIRSKWSPRNVFVDTTRICVFKEGEAQERLVIPLDDITSVDVPSTKDKGKRIQIYATAVYKFRAQSHEHAQEWALAISSATMEWQRRSHSAKKLKMFSRSSPNLSIDNSENISSSAALTSLQGAGISAPKLNRRFSHSAAPHKQSLDRQVTFTGVGSTTRKHSLDGRAEPSLSVSESKRMSLSMSSSNLNIGKILRSRSLKRTVDSSDNLMMDAVVVTQCQKAFLNLLRTTKQVTANPEAFVHLALPLLKSETSIIEFILETLLFPSRAQHSVLKPINPGVQSTDAEEKHTIDNIPTEQVLSLRQTVYWWAFSDDCNSVLLEVMNTNDMLVSLVLRILYLITQIEIVEDTKHICRRSHFFETRYKLRKQEAEHKATALKCGRGSIIVDTPDIDFDELSGAHNRHASIPKISEKLKTKIDLIARSLERVYTPEYAPEVRPSLKFERERSRENLGIKPDKTQEKAEKTDKPSKKSSSIVARPQLLGSMLKDKGHGATPTEDLVELVDVTAQSQSGDWQCEACEATSTNFCMVVVDHQSGANFTARVHRALAYMLVTDMFDWYKVKVTFSLFGSRVHNPALWQSILCVLRQAPLEERGSCLEDLTSLMVRSTLNQDSLIRQDGWQRWVIPAFEDISIKGLNVLETRVFKYAMHIIMMCSSRAFFMLAAQQLETIVLDTVRMFQLTWPRRDESLVYVNAWMNSLINDIYAHRSVFPADKSSHFIWNNLLIVLSAIKIYVFATPQQEVYDVFVRNLSKQVFPDASGEANADDSKETKEQPKPTMDRRKSRLSMRMAPNKRASFLSTVRFGDSVAYGVHVNEKGKVVDKPLVDKVVKLLLSVVDVIQYNSGIKQSPDHRDFVDQWKAELLFFQDTAEMLSIVEAAAPAITALPTVIERFMLGEDKDRKKVIDSLLKMPDVRKLVDADEAVKKQQTERQKQAERDMLKQHLMNKHKGKRKSMLARLLRSTPSEHKPGHRRSKSEADAAEL